MLRVLQVIPTLDRSGAEKQLALLAAGLPRDRFAVEVAALTRLGPLAAELRAAGIPVTPIGKRLKVDPFALGRLTRLMKAGRFDVVQTWIFAANVYGRIAARRAGVPIVVTAEMAVDLWKGRAQLAIDRYLARTTDRVVGNSNAVVDFYRDRAGVPESRLAMIPSGIDDAEGIAPPAGFDPAATRRSLGLPPSGPLAIFVGRLAEQKGVADLIDALDIVQHVEPDLRTLIVGDGPLRDRLRSVASAYTLDDRVKFLGHRDDAAHLIGLADVLILPSLYEGLPNVVLEAMRRSKPVIATAAPGTTEVVLPGVTGVLVPIRRPPILAAALRDLIRDPDRARSLGQAGRARVDAEFGSRAMIDRFATLYEDLARSKGLLPRD